MGRRRTSPAEDLIDLVAFMPWWGGVALAAVSYVILHKVAGQEVASTVQPGQLGAMLTQTMWKAAAGIGQYVLPILCLAGAAVSAWRRGERKKLLANASQSEAASMLDGIGWREFEMLVGEAFRHRDYRVAETGGSGPDGGVDLVLAKGNEKFLVQCKQWKAFRVGVDVVRELYGLMAAKGAAGGFVVTSGRFTEDARAFAQGRNVELVDGQTLRSWIAGAKRTVAGTSPVRPSDGGVADAPPAKASCPLCSKPMLKRMARHGSNKGSAFWGCSAYPACRGTRPIA